MSEPQQPATRIGFAERDAAVAELQQHHAEGRLSVEEFDQRMEAALQARTRADLEPLFADLPTSTEDGQRHPPDADRSAGTDLDQHWSSWSSTTANGSWTSTAMAGSHTVDHGSHSGGLHLRPDEPHWLSALRIAGWAAVPMGVVFLFLFGNFRWMLLAMIMAPILTGITGAITKRRDDQRRQQAELEQRKDWR